MNMCISFSIFIAERFKSKIGKYIAAPVVRIGSKIIRKTPVKPANKAPSPNPPVRKMSKIAATNPARAAGRMNSKRKRETGISRRRKAICHVAILSILPTPILAFVDTYPCVNRCTECIPSSIVVQI